jgi:predicted CoA-binding protein
MGASARPDSYGSMVLNKLLEHRYPDPIYPIYPKRDELFGLTCYPDLSSVPGPVDLI